MVPSTGHEDACEFGDLFGEQEGGKGTRKIKIGRKIEKKEGFIDKPFYLYQLTPDPLF